MGEEVVMSDYDVSGDGDRIREWEMGLPSDEDLASLSHSLIPTNLAMAFSISPEKSRTIQDVNRASETTLSSLRSGSSCPNTSSSNNNSNSFKTGVAAEEEQDRVGSSSPGSDSKKQKTSDGDGGVDLSTADATAEEGDSGTEDPTGKSLKRPRLVWTPQLHKRFVDVVSHLGVKNAVPKSIMQLMNVEGLTRENVASHLQKYRLYLKRMQGLTTEGPSASDKLFSSTPVPPQSFQDIGGGSSNGQGNGSAGVPIPVPYGAPPMMQMPVYAHHMGMQGYHHQNHGHDPYHQNHHHHHHHGTGGPGAFEANPYMMQQNKFGSMASYPSVGGGSANEN